MSTAPAAGNASAIGRLLGRVRSLPLLTAEQEVELARRIRRGDEEALRLLVSSNIRFVVKLARPYRHADMPFEDLIAEGLLGLIEAARRFDPDQGFRFVTCAVWWVRKALLSALREQTRVVRVPNFQRRKVNEIRAATETLTRRLGRAPDRTEVSAALDLPEGRVERTLARAATEFSIDQPVSGSEDGLRVSDTLPDAATGDLEDDMIRQESLALLVEALAELPAQERDVLARRYGIDGARPEVLREVGEDLGLSRERVRQIESQATRRLRRLLLRKQRPVPVRELAAWSRRLPRRDGIEGGEGVCRSCLQGTGRT